MGNPLSAGGRGLPSRRGFLTGATAAVALATAGCSAATKETSGAAPATGATPAGLTSFSDLANAGGVLGWSGLAVLGGGQSNKVFIVDAKYHKIVTALTNAGPINPRTIPSRYPNLRDCHAIVFTKDFSKMYTVTAFTYGNSTVIEYDPKTLAEVARCEAGNGSHHMALTPDDKYIYVANQYGSTVTVIDRASMTHVTDIEVGTSPDYISPSMYWDGKVISTPYLFVTVDGGLTVAVIDWKTNKVVKQIPIPASAHGVNLTPDGKHVWLAGLAFQEVWVIDVATLTTIKKLPIEGSPIHISISPDNQFAYITTSDNSIFKVNTSNYQTLWTAKGTVIPAHTGLSPDGKELWTLNHGMDTTRYPYLLGGQPVEGTQVWDTDTGKLIAEVPMEAMPHEIQFVPYSAFGVPASGQDVAIGGSSGTASTSPKVTPSPSSTGK
jgi:YVTN family beta-propeller protein